MPEGGPMLNRSKQYSGEFYKNTTQNSIFYTLLNQDSRILCFMFFNFIFVSTSSSSLDYSIQVISPTNSVLEGKPPAHGLSKCNWSVSVITLSTAQNPATPAVTKSLAFPLSL